MSSPKASPSKNISDLGINLDEEYDLDEIEEKKQKEIEADVRSITSAAVSPEEAANGSVDSKLLSILTNRSYDAIVKSAQKRATNDYLSNLTPEMNFLLQNHLRIQNEYGTSNDDKKNWRIDTESASDEEIFREINRLKRKLERIQEENDDLQQEAEQAQEKLKLIHSQNEKLERLIPLD
ncbi:hypothetical protein M9Y10_023051 [Tritrichomonas musculus]|uniref:Uncharacterized protein n=1 Tax=Tritrichomonas musculus TaxID=1915356 RepID=A0ABR2KU27_9EUKA